MPRLCIATIATEVPMGAQIYQEQIAARAAGALAQVDDRPWRVRRLIVRSMRARIAGNARMPLGRVAAASPASRRVLGGVLYRRDTLTHRMNLELPPAPAGDVVTLHDVVAWRFADESAPVRAAPEELRRAAAVICVSRFSAEEAVDMFGITEPHVIHNGVDAGFFDPDPADPTLLSSLGVDGPYVLTAGGAAHRKNLDGLAEAWRIVSAERPGLHLVLAGPEHPRRTELFRGIPRVNLLGRVPEAVLPRLYGAAAAVVVPSRYEGFGLPALEGMAAGRPVVAAATSSLPEIVGDGGFLVDPTGEALAEGILHAISDDPEVTVVAARGRARAEQFTWERSAVEHARVWASLPL